MSKWKEISLGEICEFKYGKSLPENKRVSGEVKVYGSNGQVGLHDRFLTTGPTIIIGRKGSCGEVNFSEKSCWPIDTTYYIDQSATKMNLKWLAYRLVGLGLSELNRAAAVPGLNREDAYRKKLLLPTYSDQIRIADLLDSVDALRAKRNEVIQQIDSLKGSIFLEMFGDLTINSKKWPIFNLEDLCETILDCPHSTPIYSADITDYPCIRSSDIQNGELTLSNAKYVSLNEYIKRVVRGKPQRGDIIYCREGARFGNAAIILDDSQICLGQRMMLFRPEKKLATSEFIGNFLSSSTAYRQAITLLCGSAAPHVNIRDIKKFKVPTPPVSLQKIFTHSLQRIEQLKIPNKLSNDHLNALFTSIQQLAFNGELNLNNYVENIHIQSKKKQNKEIEIFV